MNRRHEGNPYRVVARHKDSGNRIVRIAKDGASVRLMVECGYEIESARELKPEPMDAGWDR
jgi:hypothetical protein